MSPAESSTRAHVALASSQRCRFRPPQSLAIHTWPALNGRGLRALETLVALLLVASTGGCGGASAQLSSNHRAGRSLDVNALAVDKQFLDFGEVISTDSFKWNVPVRNQSDRPVVVDRMIATCSCTKIEPERLTIEPGETREFCITIDLTSKDPVESHVTPFAVQFSPITDLTEKSLKWTIRGIVRYPMIARPSTISFGETLIRGRDFPSQSVIVESDEPVEELIVNCDNQFATVNVSRRSECVFEVTITPVTTPPADFLDFPVLVLGRLKTGRANFPVKIRVTGRLIDDLQADPPVVVFSEVAKTRRAVVTVRTRTGRRLSDVSFNATDPSIHLAPLESSGNWASFEVALTDWPGNFRTSRVDFSALPPLGEQSLTASLRIVLQPTGK